MPRPMTDSPYLYGFHDPGGESVMGAAGVPGWIIFTEAIGCEPNDQGGRDYSQWSNQGYGIIARLNNGYEPGGTIPYSARYPDFARRCANYARNSSGCHIWIIGNEPNFAVERPGVVLDWNQNPPRIVRTGEVITPALYASCFRTCRAAIRSVAGHQSDQVIVAAVAPWNTQTTYEGNPSGDWVRYFSDTLTILGPKGCDGMAIHAYTHGADPGLVSANTYMDPPFQKRQFNFRTYRDFIQAIPRSMWSLPVYMTEADQDAEWRDANTGWVQRVYGEIDAWNRQPSNQKIRAVALYRWPRGLDKWGIEGKWGVIDDFSQALARRYNWESAPSTPPAVEPKEPGDQTMPTDTSAITFKETGKTAEGLFAAFYRAHGAAVTGLPLSEKYIDATTGLATQDWQRVVMEEYPAGTIRLRMIGEEWRTLTSRVKMLERQIAWLRSGATGPQQPEIIDISARLARKPAEIVKRTLGDIQYVIVNHTAVRPSIGADLVAKAQVARWPGIISQYYITEDGKIQRTNADDEVVSKDIGWIFNGLNIYVAGNFDEGVPNEAQMEALAQLCAWLLARYDLPDTALRGVSEFIVTHSPGLQWLTGSRWKNDLLSRVALYLAPPGHASAPRAVVDSRANSARVADLESQVLDLSTRLVEVQNRSTLLQSQLHHLLRAPTGTTSGVPKPIFSDIVPQLPIEADRLKLRPTAQINYLVLHHTRLDAGMPAELIAKRHVLQWGGILYHFMVGADGSIVQTSDLSQVIDLTQTWTGHGINIGLSGDFTTDVPRSRQIDATAQLCAWLMQEHKIPAENLKGACEFIESDSPGRQWLEDKRWKDQLLTAINAVRTASQSTEADDALVTALRTQMAELEDQLARQQEELAELTVERDRLLEQVSAPSEAELALREQVQSLTSQIQNLSGQMQTLTKDKAALAQQIETIKTERQALQAQNQTLTQAKADLTKQLASAAQDRTTLAQRVDELLAQIKTLQGQETGTSPAASLELPAPAIVDLVDKLAKHATLRYDTRSLNKITHIAIHHSAGPANVTPESIASYHVRKDWPGIGYHFYVEPDGSIYQTNRLETVSYHVYQHNASSVGICVAGTFTGATPTPRQIEETGHLVAWLMQELQIPVDRVWGHREFPDNATSCPGNDWLSGQKWKDQLLARIRSVQAGQIGPASQPIQHYMLFWRHDATWAREDWEAAVNYVARFGPACGFSVDEAKNAEYVTIVGGVSGVSFEDERTLVSAGCRVERLSGKDYSDTKRMLDSLAESGRRFMTFN